MSSTTSRRLESRSTKPGEPASGSAPRPSASLLVINSRNEVLLVQRNPEARSFGGAHVFPGGNYDAKQDESLEITAIRETFEESGLLLASSAQAPPSESALNDARLLIHSHRLLFREFLSEHHLTPDTTALLPFTSWTTPTNVPRRFRTQFYVAFLPAATSTGFSSGGRQERIPTPDGGQEVVSARFLHPADALAEFRARKIAFMPPQYYLLETLAGILSSRQNTPAERSKVEELSCGEFGRMSINPVGVGSDAEGRAVLTYEGDETRGGSKGRLHRVHARMGKAGCSEMVLYRNFDVFTEIEPAAFQPQNAAAKL
ncbi:hypothetical protein PLICRDRAFT_175788 [Plicaturopsis crispa FD-325 SS-3]|nr:hypothetical protein PLICRDRAFT_175788 [Plicaturopsis crispa FD-325 SS-3]